MSEHVEIIADLKDLISGKFADINKQIDAMDSKLSKVGGGSIGGGGIMGQVLGANLLTNAISRAGSAIMDFGKESFYAYGKSEQFLTSLTTMLKGNADEAKALDNQLKGFALETPFELTEIRDATKMMVAYGSSAGNVVGEMRMLGDISSGVGSSLSEVAYLYGTLRTQGRAFSKDIYQFTGRGIPIIKELAKQFHVADSAVMKLVEDGRVGFKEVEKAMKSMTDEGGQFHNMMIAQSKTLLGQTSNLADAWDQLKTAIGESQQGILKSTIAWATDMVNEMKRVAESKNFREKATSSVPDQFKIDKKGFWSSLLGFTPGYGEGDNPIDTRFMAVNEKTFQRELFKSQDMRDAFMEVNGNEWGAGATLGTENIFKLFSNTLKGKFDELSKSKNKTQDIPKFMREMLNERQDIINQLDARQISSTLAVNELAVISELQKQVSALKGLENSKNSPEQKPKDLESVAKKNKAVQVIVNIENLIKELTNVNNEASKLNQLTTDGTLKALLVAVNDIYAVGQL